MKLNKTSYDYAFLVHPRDLSDIYKKYSFLRLIPERVILALFKYVPPITVASIKGLVSDSGKEKNGVIISLPLTGMQMLNNKTLATKHVVRAMKKAKSFGVKHIGLGAFTSVVTNGGEDVKDAVEDTHVTNGNALTAHVTYEGVIQVIKEHNITNVHIAVIGATGSIGSALTKKLLSNDVCEKVYLVGRTKKNIDTLFEMIQSCVFSKRAIKTSLESAIEKADIVLTATSAQSAVIQPELLKRNAIVYDITQPKNIPNNLSLLRPDVTVIDGGLVELPKKIDIQYDLGLPKHTTYACMAETMLLSLAEYPDDFCIGKVSEDTLNYASKFADRYAFTSVKKQVIM